jgi:hypothetical protein
VVVECGKSVSEVRDFILMKASDIERQEWLKSMNEKVELCMCKHEPNFPENNG